MQTSFLNTQGFAVEGMPVGPRKTRSYGLPFRKQAVQIRIADGSPAAGETWSVSIYDRKSLQTWSYEFTSGATLALTLTAWQAAHRLNAKANSLFAVTNDGVDDFLPIANHGNRSYTWTVTTGGGTATATVSELTAAGGGGVEFGRLVVRSTIGEHNFDAIGASSVIGDIVGGVFRTDANHVHPDPDGDTVDFADVLPRGKHHAVIWEGRMWVKVEDAVEEGDRVYCRRALTAGAGRLGGFRSTPAGSAQVLTITPIVNQAVYGFNFNFRWEGRNHNIKGFYTPTDATTSIADATAGLLDSINTSIAAHGLTGQLTAADITTALTITTLAGTEITEVDTNVWYLDTEASTVTASLGAADVDTIDVGSICEFESDSAADGYALLHIVLQPGAV